MYWITVIGMFIATLIIKAFSDPIAGEFNCAIAPLVLAGIGFGIKGASALLGGGKSPELSQELQGVLKANARIDRTTAFTPDRTAIDERISLQIQQIFEQFGVNLENFNADAASRGVFTGGEANKVRGRDVLAPAVRAASSAVVQGNVQFEELKIRGLIAGDTANQNAIGLQARFSTPQQSGFQRFLNSLGGAADTFAGGFTDEFFSGREDDDLIAQIQELKKLGLI